LHATIILLGFFLLCFQLGFYVALLQTSSFQIFSLRLCSILLPTAIVSLLLDGHGGLALSASGAGARRTTLHGGHPVLVPFWDLGHLGLFQP